MNLFLMIGINAIGITVKGIGMKVLYYPSGSVYAELDESSRTYFYENGTLKTIYKIENGKPEGEVLLYWPNGAIKRKVFFKNGIREGVEQMWDEAGHLVDEEVYGNI